MKRFKTFMMLSSVAALCAVSCDDTVSPADDTVQIKIGLISEPPVMARPGDEVEYTFSISCEGGLKEVSAMLNNEILEGSTATWADAPVSADWSFSYVVKDEDAGNTLDFSAVVSSADGLKKSYDVPLYVQAAEADIQISVPEDAPEEWNLGEELTFSVSVVSATDIRQIATYKNGNVLEELIMTEFEDRRNVAYPFSYMPEVTDIGAETTFRFEVMDVNGNIVSAEYSVSVIRPASDEISEFFGVTIGYQRNAAGSFLDAQNGTVYVFDGCHLHCEEIDMLFFYSNSGGAGMSITDATTVNAENICNAATIGAMGGTDEDIVTNWSTRNATYFKNLSDEVDNETFASIYTEKEIIDLYENSAQSETQLVNRLQPGNIIGFRIPLDADGISNEYGMLKVVSRGAKNTETVVIDYKITK